MALAAERCRQSGRSPTSRERLGRVDLRAATTTPATSGIPGTTAVDRRRQLRSTTEVCRGGTGARDRGTARSVAGDNHDRAVTQPRTEHDRAWISIEHCDQ
jgi:hypothetical protein